MAIAERQLETWAQPGKTGQFTDTYNIIRGHLLDKGAPYPVGDAEVFFQGSVQRTRTSMPIAMRTSTSSTTAPTTTEAS